MTWTHIVILICIAIAAFGVYREYQREVRSFLILRIVATILAAIALACLILPVSYPSGTFATSDPTKLLLTEGFNKDSLLNKPNDSLFTLDRSVHQQYPKTRLLNDISELYENTHPEVYGYGLTDDELDMLDGKPLNFHPSPRPDGIIAANWTEQLKTGEAFRLQLKYKNTSSKLSKLVLKALSTTVDSVVIPAASSKDISLQFTPKNSGRVVYNLIALDQKDTLQTEQLPVNIEAVKPLKVLILSTSPDFESKFLKTWLGENSYGVAARSTIAKGKYSQEYFNMDKPDLAHLSAGLLNKFDVLIGDLSLLKTLTPSESGALQQEVLQRGLGIIIRADSSGKAVSWLDRDFRVIHLAGKQPAPASLIISGKNTAASLTLEPTYIGDQKNIQTIVADQHHNLLAAATLTGTGKLIFSTINNSYNWLLSGNKSDYTTLWSSLIGKVARKSPPAENWQITTPPAMQGNPVKLILEGTPGSNIKVDQTNAYAAQDPAVPFQQILSYWPSASGWHQAVVNNGKPYWWYTWPNGSWKSAIAAHKINATIQYALRYKEGSAVKKQILQKSWVAVPKIYFFILFLIAATFLWAESKFFNQ